MSFNNLYSEYLQEETRRTHPLRRTRREIQLANQMNKLANQYALWHARGGTSLSNKAELWRKYRAAELKWMQNWNANLTPLLKLNSELRARHNASERNKRLRSAPTLKRLAWNAAGLKGITAQQLRALSKLPGVYSQLNLLHPNKVSTRRSLSQPPRRARSSRAVSAPR